MGKREQGEPQNKENPKTRRNKEKPNLAPRVSPPALPLSHDLKKRDPGNEVGRKLGCRMNSVCDFCEVNELTDFRYLVC